MHKTINICSKNVNSLFFKCFLGGKSYDKHHLVVREENEEHASQQWELEFV